MFLTEIFRTQILSLIVIIEFKKKRKKKKEKRKKKKEKRKEKLHLMRITISTYCWTKALSVLLFTYTGC